MKGNLNMENNNSKVKNKIIKLANGTEDNDAVNFTQLKWHTVRHGNNYHLQPSFTFYKNFDNKSKLLVDNKPFMKIPNHNHHGLQYIDKEGSYSGFGGQAWGSLKMTNNLVAGVYTILNNETLITQVLGDDNYKIINFSHDYQTTHSKAFIQFTSNGQPGEITFQFRYYGSSYNEINLLFLFFFTC